MTYNILIIGQSGRLQYEAIMFLASLRQSAPDFKAKSSSQSRNIMSVGHQNPAITDPEIRALIQGFGRKD